MSTSRRQEYHQENTENISKTCSLLENSLKSSSTISQQPDQTNQTTSYFTSSRFRHFTLNAEEILQHKKIADQVKSLDCYQVKVGMTSYPIPKIIVDSEIKALHMTTDERIRKLSVNFYSDETILDLIKNGHDIESPLKYAEDSLRASIAANNDGGGDGYGPNQERQIKLFIDIIKKISQMINPVAAMKEIERINVHQQRRY